MKMKKKKLILGILAFTFCACVTDASKIYVTLNVDGNYISNVPTPVADSHAVNKRYAHQLYAQNVLNALPAKCAGGQHGVDWSTNTRFTVDSTGSNVYDNLTGLMWIKNANIIGPTNWAYAITYCTSLVYGGYSDWRLPNVKELTSLVDLSNSNPSLPLGHPFSAVQLDDYWSSSTSVAAGGGMAWHVTFDNGSRFDFLKTQRYCVWPVRSVR